MKLKVLSSQLCLRFKQSQLSPKNVFGASTGIEPMASALALQCSTLVLHCSAVDLAGPLR